MSGSRMLWFVQEVNDAGWTRRSDMTFLYLYPCRIPCINIKKSVECCLIVNPRVMFSGEVTLCTKAGVPPAEPQCVSQPAGEPSDVRTIQTPRLR